MNSKFNYDDSACNKKLFLFKYLTNYKEKIKENIVNRTNKLVTVSIISQTKQKLSKHLSFIKKKYLKKINKNI